MTIENNLTNLNSIHSDLKIVKELVYDKCGFKLTNLKQNLESKEYGACSFMLNEKIVLQRFSKITPSKIGQFVSIWKRNKNGITEPFENSDNFDFLIITSRNENNFGLFIFPKSVLAANEIITKNGKKGKRGIRVYPTWDNPTNKQAIKTQKWQSKYFISISNNNLEIIKKILIYTNEIN